MNTEKLRLDQAPPLSIPTAFFLVAPASAAVAGLLLLVRGGGLLASGWVPGTVALVHLGTLGFLGSVMIGALLQLVPVLAGSPVPRVGLARLVMPLLLLGVGLLVGGLLAAGQPVAPALVQGARLALLLAFTLFLGPVGLALVRSRSERETSWGMRLAVLCLALAVAAGLWMADGHGGGTFPGPRGPWIQAHLGLGLLGWVGALLSAVSWQVVPMFYLTRPVPPAARLAVLALLAPGALLPPLALALGASPLLSTLLAGPGVVAAWLLNPALLARAIATRTRKRPDPSLRAWQVGLAAGPLAALAALASALSADPRWPVLLVWLVVWAHAGLIAHGMLTRILPFLVWFHRWSGQVGRVRVPSMRSLLPDRLAQAGLLAHALSAGVGALAIVSGLSPLAHLAGLLMIATAGLLLAELVVVLRPRQASALG